MNEPQVIKAVFYNWRPVVGHKRLQLIFEVPLEDTSVVLKMLGPPMPDKETWCAIALLEPVAMQDFFDQQQHGHTVGIVPNPKRAFCDLSFPQQAGIKSNDLKFKLWMSVNYPAKNGEDCASAIRDYCGVKSRKEILPGTEAGEKWLDLLRAFDGYR